MIFNILIFLVAGCRLKLWVYRGCDGFQGLLFLLLLSFFFFSSLVVVLMDLVWFGFSHVTAGSIFRFNYIT